jgi:hypothetical protein
MVKMKKNAFSKDLLPSATDVLSDSDVVDM